MVSSMKTSASRLDLLDQTVTAYMARYGITLLRMSVGVVFFWFGFLKFFPGLSPAEGLATKTLEVLSFGMVQPRVAVIVLAAWECAVGLGLILAIFLRTTLLLLWLQMAGTIAPMLLFPQEVFSHFPYAPTLEGQYIIKNLVLASAGVVVGATVRGGRLRS